MKTTVIYHSADYDGLFCREIARKFLPGAELIGWDYGNPRVPYPTEGLVYVLDLSPDCFTLPPFTSDSKNDEHLSRLIWIDHHKSAIDNQPTSIPGYRIDGVAACRLAWQWFTHSEKDLRPESRRHEVLPIKKAFIERTVSEPLAVRLAGEYDIWDHRGDGDLEFQFGLDSVEAPSWDVMLDGFGSYTQNLVEIGKSAMQCYKKRDADIMLTRSFLIAFEGLKFLCLNTARCNSNSFLARDKPETGHDALMAFYWTGSAWSVSLYHAAHQRDIDLSKIAVKHGGGGHRGACGFRAERLPFIP